MIEYTKMELEKMKRKQLQALCKKHNLPANTTNLEMTRALSSLLEEQSCTALNEISGVEIAEKETKVKQKVENVWKKLEEEAGSCEGTIGVDWIGEEEGENGLKPGKGRRGAKRRNGLRVEEVKLGGTVGKEVAVVERGGDKVGREMKGFKRNALGNEDEGEEEGNVVIGKIEKGRKVVRRGKGGVLINQEKEQGNVAMGGTNEVPIMKKEAEKVVKVTRGSKRNGVRNQDEEANLAMDVGNEMRIMKIEAEKAGKVARQSKRGVLKNKEEDGAAPFRGDVAMDESHALPIGKQETEKTRKNLRQSKRSVSMNHEEANLGGDVAMKESHEVPGVQQESEKTMKNPKLSKRSVSENQEEEAKLGGDVVMEETREVKVVRRDAAKTKKNPRRSGRSVLINQAEETKLGDVAMAETLEVPSGKQEAEKTRKNPRRSKRNVLINEEEEANLGGDVAMKEISEVPDVKQEAGKIEKNLRRSKRSVLINHEEANLGGDVSMKETREVPVVKEEAEKTKKNPRWLKRSVLMNQEEEDNLGHDVSMDETREIPSVKQVVSHSRLKTPHVIVSESETAMVWEQDVTEKVPRLEYPEKNTGTRASKRKRIAPAGQMVDTTTTLGRAKKLRKQSGKSQVGEDVSVLEAGMVINADMGRISEFEKRHPSRSTHNAASENLVPQSDKKVKADETKKRDELLKEETLLTEVVEQEQPSRRSRRLNRTARNPRKLDAVDNVATTAGDCFFEDNARVFCGEGVELFHAESKAHMEALSDRKDRGIGEEHEENAEAFVFFHHQSKDITSFTITFPK